MSLAKLDQLKNVLRGYESCLVAYSGGVDSSLLAYVAHQTLGDKGLAVIADSPSLPRREFDEALALGRRFQFPVRVIQTAEFQDEEYLKNPINRCYFCKFALFDVLKPLASEEGFKVIAYGENASDVGDFRPGAQAAAEFEVRAPMKEIGLTKQEIRDLSSHFGLPTADKPQMACLSSRIPHGEAVNESKLAMIERAEYCLRDLGFYDLRVRHHELSNGHLARIELGLEEIQRILDKGLQSKVVQAIQEAGYQFVTLDLAGYQRGGGFNGGIQTVNQGQSSENE